MSSARFKTRVSHVRIGTAAKLASSAAPNTAPWKPEESVRLSPVLWRSEHHRQDENSVNGTLSKGLRTSAIPVTVRYAEKAGRQSAGVVETERYAIEREDAPLARPHTMRPQMIAQTLESACCPAHEYSTFPNTHAAITRRLPTLASSREDRQQAQQPGIQQIARQRGGAAQY